MGGSRTTFGDKVLTGEHDASDRSHTNRAQTYAFKKESAGDEISLTVVFFFFRFVHNQSLLVSPT